MVIIVQRQYNLCVCVSQCARELPSSGSSPLERRRKANMQLANTPAARRAALAHSPPTAFDDETRPPPTRQSERRLFSFFGGRTRSRWGKSYLCIREPLGERERERDVQLRVLCCRRRNSLQKSREFEPGKSQRKMTRATRSPPYAGRSSPIAGRTCTQILFLKNRI